MQTQTQTKDLVNPLPFFFIGRDLTNERINNYLTQKHSLLSQSLGKQDTKKIWYSRDHFAKLLEEIDYAGGDGILLSFGMYESTHEYAGQTCLVMNLTRETTRGGNTLHQIVQLEDEPNYPERSSLPREFVVVIGDDPFEPRDRDFNYGSPCPPRCDISDYGDDEGEGGNP